MKLSVVGIVTIVLGGKVTCDTVLTSMCGSGSMEIWFTCIGNGTGYFMSLMVTSITSSACDSNSESEEVQKLLLG